MNIFKRFYYTSCIIIKLHFKNKCFVYSVFAFAIKQFSAATKFESDSLVKYFKSVIKNIWEIKSKQYRIQITSFFRIITYFERFRWFCVLGHSSSHTLEKRNNDIYQVIRYFKLLLYFPRCLSFYRIEFLGMIKRKTVYNS